MLILMFFILRMTLAMKTLSASAAAGHLGALRAIALCIMIIKLHVLAIDLQPIVII